jgi:hypothetical protein
VSAPRHWCASDALKPAAGWGLDGGGSKRDGGGLKKEVCEPEGAKPIACALDPLRKEEAAYGWGSFSP